MEEAYLFGVLADILLQIEFNSESECSEIVKQMRKESVSQLLPYFLRFHEEGFLPELIERAFRKKAAFILKATTTKEVKEIMKPSVPYYDYANYVPKNRFHVEEEELMLWCGVMPYCKFRDDATHHVLELFKKLFPEVAENVLNPK